MVNEHIVRYLEEGKLAGKSISSMKSELSAKGYPEKDITESVFSMGGDDYEDKRFSNVALEAIRVNAPVFLRVSMGLMYLWFGMSQLLNPELYLGFIPKYASIFPLSAIETVYLNGIFEICLSMILLLGFLVRSVAFSLSVHLYIIGLSVVNGGIMVRDLALATALFVVFLNGSDKLCLSRLLRTKH